MVPNANVNLVVAPKYVEQKTNVEPINVKVFKVTPY